LDSKGDKGSLAFEIIEEVSKVLVSSSASESKNIVKVTLAILKSITGEFKETIKTEVDVIKVMKESVTKIKESYDSGEEEEKTAITIVSTVVESIDSELGEDEKVSRSKIYSLIAETTNIIFEASTSASTVKWLEMYSFTSTAVGEEYEKVSSDSNKEAGNMIAKYFKLIMTEFDSSSDSSSYDSGKLISSMIDESVSLLSDSSAAASSSFNSGLLLINVAKGIVKAYTRATSYSDSGRLLTASMISLNKDITETETSSTKVKQPELFLKVSKAVLEKFSDVTDGDTSGITAGAIIVRVVKAVNDELGSDVDKAIETVTLYVNVLKAIVDEFEDITTFSDEGKKEAKAMIAAVEVLDGSLPSSIDTGDLIVQILTDIHELYDPDDTRVDGPLQFIEAILQTIADFFHGNSRKKGKLKKIQKNMTKALRQELFS